MRAATGTPVFEGNAWYAKITLGDGSRTLVPLPLPKFSVEEYPAPKRGADGKLIIKESIREACRAIAERERRDGTILKKKQAALAAGQVPRKLTGETVAAYAKRWLEHRATLDLTSIGDDVQRMRDHLLPALGDLGIKDVSKADARRLVEHLDDKVRRGELGWNTAGKCWTLARTMFKDACSSKRAEFVVRDDDPTDKVKGPDKGDELERTYLYPSEFAKLITCKAIPVYWRRLYALAAYTLSRAGELKALRWDAVDFDRMVIHFRQATDRRGAGRKKRTKVGKNRRIPIEAALLPLLEVLKREAGESPYVIHVQVSKRAERLREHLELAGITRAELFEPADDVAATWAPLTFHDLRGTGVTWSALRGDEPLVIQQRAGHANFSTTQRYLREAETLGKDAGAPFPPLPSDLLGGADEAENDSSDDSSEPRVDAQLDTPEVPKSGEFDTAGYMKEAAGQDWSASNPVSRSSFPCKSPVSLTRCA